jgi:hypothetical protein
MRSGNVSEAPDAVAGKTHCSEAKAMDGKLRRWALRELFFNLNSNGNRCILFDQILTLQVRPELSRNFGVHRGVVFQYLMFSADADH